MRTLIHSARLVSGGHITEDGWVLFEGDTISALGAGRPPVPAAPADVVDASRRWLTPGFIDIHCHGGGGASFDEGIEGARTALAVHRAHGTTRSVLSLVTAPLSDLGFRLRLISALSEADPLVLGAHLEGPFLDPGHSGAHDPSLLRPPTRAAIDTLLEAGAGSIRQVTLAPEQPGGIDAVGQFVGGGVAVAVGHSNVDYDGALAAFDAGASIVTHIFNAMNGLHHRSPGPVAAAFHTAGVTLELINDGVHMHDEMVQLAFTAAAGRIAMVTDAMAGAGAADGIYPLGASQVQVRRGVARLVNGNSLAGSTLTLDEALRRAVQGIGLPLATAVTALTETPARAMGRAHDLGRLAVGYAADAVLLNHELRVDGVWAAGQAVATPAA
jgi:N-acetylglucosamine-6-phosphate deacetylase